MFIGLLWSCVEPGVGCDDPYGLLPTWVVHDSVFFPQTTRWLKFDRVCFNLRAMSFRLHPKSSPIILNPGEQILQQLICTSDTIKTYGVHIDISCYVCLDKCWRRKVGTLGLIEQSLSFGIRIGCAGKWWTHRLWRCLRKGKM